MAEVLIRDGLKGGLRESDENERNSERLTLCQNARPTKYGLVQHYPINFPPALQTAIASAGLSVSHPFPQLFKGKHTTYLFTETKVYSVNESTWAITPLSLVNLAGSPATISSGGGAWQFVDCHQTWYATNGVTTVFQAEVNGVTAVRVDTSVPVQTGCELRGRVLFGGFDPNNYWTSTWDAHYESWTDNYIVPTTGVSPSGIGSNFISWSSIGGGDTLGLIYPDLLIAGQESYSSGGHDSDRPIYFDFLDRNEAGFMPMPFSGSVLCLRPLGGQCMVYGDEGIAAVYTASAPVPTFGLKELTSLGIASRTAVGGDDNEHVFLDSSGSLWHIDAELALTELDFAEDLSALTDSEVTIVKDPQKGDFHIAGKVGGNSVVYTLTKSGLYKHKHAVTSAYFLPKTLDHAAGMVGVYEEIADTDEAIVQTDTFDFGTRDIKTLQGVEVGSTANTAIQVKVLYRTNASQSWMETEYRSVSSEGWVDLVVSGVEFQIQVYYADYENFERIDYIRLLWRGEGPRSMKDAIT